jgi:hypothetical protein
MLLKMKLEIFALCDAATDQNGKLNILGAFDTIFAPQLPLVYQNCAVAAKMRWDKTEEGRKQIRISFSDPDGRAVIPALDAPIEVRVPDNAHDITTSATNFVVTIQQIKLERAGEHEIDLFLDGELQGSLPLYIVPAAPRR